MKRCLGWGWAVLLWAAVGCNEPAVRPAAHAKRAPEREATRFDPDTIPRPMASIMDDHFIIGSWVRDTVIAGELEALREPLTALADYEYPEDTTGLWRTSFEELRSLARETSAATTLSQAASGVAGMAKLCGRCHASYGVGPKAELERREVFSAYGEQTFTGRMYRHAWGATQLWQGLTSPSLEAWKLGADAIAEAPSQMELELPLRLGQELAELRSLGRAAQTATTLDDQAQIYGKLLATCATCHARTNAAALRGAREPR